MPMQAAQAASAQCRDVAHQLPGKGTTHPSPTLRAPLLHRQIAAWEPSHRCTGHCTALGNRAEWLPDPHTWCPCLGSADKVHCSRTWQNRWSNLCDKLDLLPWSRTMESSYKWPWPAPYESAQPGQRTWAAMACRSLRLSSRAILRASFWAPKLVASSSTSAAPCSSSRLELESITAPSGGSMHPNPLSAGLHTPCAGEYICTEREVFEAGGGPPPRLNQVKPSPPAGTRHVAAKFANSAECRVWRKFVMPGHFERLHHKRPVPGPSQHALAACAARPAAEPPGPVTHAQWGPQSLQSMVPSTASPAAGPAGPRPSCWHAITLLCLGEAVT